VRGDRDTEPGRPVAHVQRRGQGQPRFDPLLL
jgi:hypothetical protein